MAVATKAKETKMIQAPEDAARAKYIVREEQDGARVETLSVGLASYKKKWNASHLSDDDFYDFILQTGVQQMLNIGVRVASEKDLEKYSDQIAIKELVQQHINWDKDELKRKNELRAKIIKWVKENVETEEQLKTFLIQNNINTNQLQAMARGARFEVRLSDEFIEMFAAYVSAKSQATKSARTPAEVSASFYDRD